MLSSVLSAKTCAECRNCCIFEEKSAWELPSFSIGAAARLADHPDYTLTEENGRYRISLPYDDTHTAKPCPFLDDNTGCTLPPEEKPFACSIWPVRVMRDPESGEPRLALYQGCTGIPADEHPELDALLANGLRDRIFAECAADPTLILPYHPNYRFL